MAVCHVVVTSLAGDSLELDLAPQSTILDLKQAVATTAWRVPEACQHLVDANARSPVGDSDVLENDHYMLLVSLEAVYRTLQIGGIEQRVEALQNLCKLGPKGGDAALEAVLARLEDDPSVEVREDAIEALTQLAAHGNRRAAVVGTIAARMCCSDVGVREVAVGALARVAEAGDPAAISAAIGSLKDRDWRVRKAAAKALARISSGGDQRCLEALATALNDRHDGPTEAAVEAIARIADVGDERSITALSEFLKRPNRTCVKAAAKRALAMLSGG